MSRGLLCVSLIFAGLSVARSEMIENYRAKLYKLGDEVYRLYVQSSVTESADGQKTIHNVYFYGAGPDQVAAEEKAFYQKDQLKDYLIVHHQLQENWRTTIEGDHVVFRKRDWDSKETDEGREKLTENFVVAPMVIPYLQKRWQKIQSGETIYVRFGVPARKETVGFKLFKDAEGTLDGEPTIIIKMKPSSFFIALLVDPLYMHMKKDGSALLRLKGRTLPRKLVDGKWKDTDVDTHFQNLSKEYDNAVRPTAGD